ncbi:hypothetical protein [Methylobacterium sp. JK268]
MDQDGAIAEAPAPPRPEVTAPPISFAVTADGPDAVALAVSFGPRTYPIRLGTAEAAELGLTLIATASVAADRDHPVAPGTRVENCFFPVLRWTAGLLAPGRPALALTIAEGTEIAFQFSEEAARACGRDLRRSGTRPLWSRLSEGWTRLRAPWARLAQARSDPGP